MLTWGHIRVIEKLHHSEPSCPRALCDRFAQPKVLQDALKKQGVQIYLKLRTKADNDVAVIAASFLARERFLDLVEKTNTASGIQLSLGASDAVIGAGRSLAQSHGKDALTRVAKLHLRSTMLVLDGDRRISRGKIHNSLVFLNF